MKDSELVQEIIRLEVGDKILIKSWVDIKKTLDSRNCCKLCRRQFVESGSGIFSNMKDICGRKSVIKSAVYNESCGRYESCGRFMIEANHWYWCKHWLVLI